MKLLPTFLLGICLLLTVTAEAKKKVKKRPPAKAGVATEQKAIPSPRIPGKYGIDSTKKSQTLRKQKK